MRLEVRMTDSGLLNTRLHQEGGVRHPLQVRSAVVLSTLCETHCCWKHSSVDLHFHDIGKPSYAKDTKYFTRNYLQRGDTKRWSSFVAT